jgi:hypothetical protein
MEIKIETIYGNVNLRSCYDCDSSSDFYSAYDDNDNHLGDLWNLPYYDEDDEESMECLKDALEIAIECNDICIPSEEIPSDDENEDDLIYLVTVLEYDNGCATAESYAYDSMEKCREAKIIRVNAFTEKCAEYELNYEVHDADVICEIMTENKSKYLCITMKGTTVM